MYRKYVYTYTIYMYIISSNTRTFVVRVRKSKWKHLYSKGTAVDSSSKYNDSTNTPDESHWYFPQGGTFFLFLSKKKSPKYAHSCYTFFFSSFIVFVFFLACFPRKFAWILVVACAISFSSCFACSPLSSFILSVLFLACFPR